MTTQEIAEFVAGELTGSGSVHIRGIASLDSATQNDLAFVAQAHKEVVTNAGCILGPLDLIAEFSVPVIKVLNPKLAFAKISKLFTADGPRNGGVHATASIDPTATVESNEIGAFTSIDENSYIAAGCQIHDGVRIGQNVTVGGDTIIRANCVIYDNVSIGKECIIHAGTVIGAPGFGYVKDDSGEYVQFPQIGTVVIEDRVEIGANSCVDRGALGETRIGEGTKIDNLVQIGHNVRIGKRVVIAAQTGISGSTVIEDDCVIGGQVGMGDHAKILSGAIIGSQAGVLPGKIVREGIWWGTPVQPLDNYKIQNAMVKGLPRMRDEIRKLREAVARLTDIDRSDPELPD